MAVNKTPPYRAEHVGSFIRPDALLEAARSYKKGDIDGHKFEEIKNKAISEIIAFQDEIGLPSITDGEFRRRVWSGGVSDALTGMSLKPVFLKNISNILLVCSFGSYPIKYFFPLNKSDGYLLGIVITLKFAPLCILACSVYLPSTNK